MCPIVRSARVRISCVCVLVVCVCVPVALNLSTVPIFSAGARSDREILSLSGRIEFPKYDLPLIGQHQSKVLTTSVKKCVFICSHTAADAVIKSSHQPCICNRQQGFGVRRAVILSICVMCTDSRLLPRPRSLQPQKRAIFLSAVE